MTRMLRTTIAQVIIGVLVCAAANGNSAATDAGSGQTTGFAAPVTAAPPVARAIPVVLHEQGNERVDPYQWLARRDDPAVAAYLAAENDYAGRRLEAVRPLADAIAAELRQRRAEPDASVPYLDNGYWYQRRFAAGAQYPVIVRRRDAPGAAEEVVLDQPALAAGHPMFRLNRWQVSPDGSRVAYAVDFTGGRHHRLFVRTLATGDVADQGVLDAAASFAFAADGATLFYVRNEPETVRSYQVWRHRIGSVPDFDTLVYEERDPGFSVSVSLTKSRRFILIDSQQERASEVRVLPADQPDGALRVIEPRRPGLRYGVDHVGTTFYIRTNLDAPDYRIMTSPEGSPALANWHDLIAQQPGRFIWRMEPFENFVAVDEEHDGRVGIRVLRLADREEFEIPLPSEIGVATTGFFYGSFGGNREADAGVLRLRFSAPLIPERIYDFDMERRTLTLRQETPAPWFDPAAYAVERIAGTAQDGESVTVTLVYRRDRRRDGGNPTLVIGYGAYGLSQRPVFTPSVFSLIDRGFVYALAHVRGGREKGERWYQQGRVLNKHNSFTDFVVAAEALVQQGFADRRALFAQGGSAGGMLVGGVANLRPDLFAGIVAEVPAVDVITTMSTPSMPLVTLEYEEWGNPAIAEQYRAMLAYSPYDNVTARAYPPMFVTAGFNDTQVSYAEPAKWVAKLRASKTDDNEIVFKTAMDAGHSGQSGRLGTVAESAEIMAWLVGKATAAERP